MSHRKMGALVALAGAVTLLVSTTGLGFGPSRDAEPLRRSVQYSDLNLGRPADVQALYGRIERAAEYVCSPLARNDLSLKAKWSECRDQAVSTAVAKVGNAKLAEYHAAHARRTA